MLVSVNLPHDFYIVFVYCMVLYKMGFAAVFIWLCMIVSCNEIGNTGLEGRANPKF